MNPIKLMVIVAALTFAIAACSESASKPDAAQNANKAAAPVTANAATKPVDDVAAGKELYAKNCMICHRDTGKGGNITIEGKKLDPEDLTSDKMKKLDDAKLAEYISDGVPDEGMPAFKNKLKPDEIKQVIKHIRTLQAGPLANS